MDEITSSPSSIKKKDAWANEETSGAVISTRRVSTKAVTRVNKGRQRARSRIATRSTEEEDEQRSESETEEEGYTRESSVNHHYTFNLPSLPANRSEVPYMLLGYVGPSLIPFLI
jgi:hypothetical protein